MNILNKNFWSGLTSLFLVLFVVVGSYFIFFTPNQAFAGIPEDCTFEWASDGFGGMELVWVCPGEGGGDEQLEGGDGGGGEGGGGGGTPPASPTNLSALPDSTCGSDTIYISWAEVSGTNGYTVYDSGDAPYSGSASVIYSGSMPTTQVPSNYSPGYGIAHTVLLSASEHHYYVSASNAYGTSPWSGPVYAVAPADCPPPSISLTADPASISYNTSTTINWTTHGADSCTASGAWSGSKSVLGGSESTGNLIQNSTYTLSCTGSGGSSQQSVTVTVGPSSANIGVTSSIPTNWEIDPGDLKNPSYSQYNSSGSYTVSPGAGTTYTIYPINQYGHLIPPTVTNDVNGSGASFTLSHGQSGNFTITYVPIEYCPDGSEAPGNDPANCTVSLSLDADPASVVFNGVSTLTWSSNNATSCTASGAWSGAKALDGSQSTGNLEVDSTYTLTCTGPGGSSQDSATVTVGTPPLNTPTNLTATAVSDSQVNLSWSDNSNGEQGFKIERKTGAGGTWSQIHVTGNNIESYENTGLFADTTYYYRVRATNNNGDSAYSNEASVSTPPSPAEISVDVTPNNASWTITPGNIQRTGDDAVTVNPSGEGTGYTITPGPAPSGYEDNPTITNSQGGGSSITLFGGEEVSFIITYERSFDYSLSNGGNISVQKGGGSYIAYGQTTITKTLSPTSGPTQSVDLSVSGLPSGVTIDSISSPTCSPTCTSTLTLAVSSSATTGTHPITVTGSPLNKTTNFSLIIENSPDLFVSCESTPSSAQVGQNVSWMANVTQNPPESPYTFYWTGTNVPTDPAPSTQSFNIVYTTTGVKNVDVLVTDSKGKTGTCSPLGSINIGVTPIFEEF